ncbi:MAG: PEP-CTERM sorting domain-containing protein [Planctomycetaceae bacterium]|nr:PEP-CTERM sorting domain-containing protein [Planctomycetaceae bacterium]
MNDYFRIIGLTSAICCLLIGNDVRGEIVAADDFLYRQPTKELGPGGGFTRQDYGGGQNGPNAGWTGRWVSSGNGIITGTDIEEPADAGLGVTAAGLSPIYANYLNRGVNLSGLAADQTLYFSVQARMAEDDVSTLPHFWLNAPVGDPFLDESQISVGIDDFGSVTAELGLDIESNDDELLNDGDFHLLVGKLEINADGNDERLTVWADPTGTEEGSSASVEADVIGSLSDLRSEIQLGRMGGGGTAYWDNVAIGTSWDDVAEVNVPRATLQINPATGQTSLVNTSGTDFELTYYEINSESGSLNVAGWNSLDDQGVGDEAWLENSPTSNSITESNFSGSTTLANGDSLSLGSAFDPAGSQDIVGRFATDRGLLNITLIDYSDTVIGDYNGNGLLDAGDLDLNAAVGIPAQDLAYDLNNDGIVNTADRVVWVNDLKNTWMGDADLNGVFDSGDLVTVFAAAKYETGQEASWGQGDWSGDQKFDSGDLVVAFSNAGYEAGERPGGPNPAVAVPEPSTAGLLVAALGLLLLRRRR